MDVIMFVAVDMGVSVVMVGLVGVGGLLLTAVAAKYFTFRYNFGSSCPVSMYPFRIGKISLTAHSNKKNPYAPLLIS